MESFPCVGLPSAHTAEAAQVCPAVAPFTHTRQVRGVKRFTLLPPTDVAFLYERDAHVLLPYMRPCDARTPSCATFAAAQVRARVPRGAVREARRRLRDRPRARRGARALDPGGPRRRARDGELPSICARNAARRGRSRGRDALLARAVVPQGGTDRVGAAVRAPSVGLHVGAAGRAQADHRR